MNVDAVSGGDRDWCSKQVLLLASTCLWQESPLLNVQRACQSAIDLAVHLVLQSILGMPADSRDAFLRLEWAGLLDPDLATRVRGMVGFRNIVLGRYHGSTFASCRRFSTVDSTTGCGSPRSRSGAGDVADLLWPLPASSMTSCHDHPAGAARGRNTPAAYGPGQVRVRSGSWSVGAARIAATLCPGGPSAVLLTSSLQPIHAMRQLLSLCLTALAVTAQSPLTTTFLNNNAGAVGGGVYFDLNVTIAAGITITGLDLNVTGAGSVDVYIASGGRTGIQTNMAAWTLVSSGTVSSLGVGLPSPVAISPFSLTAGLYGVALAAVGGVAHSYTYGNGANQTVITNEVTLLAGEATNTAFVGGLFTPRVVNTNIYFTSTGSGTFATNTTLGQGCIRAYASAYESFASPAAFDLNGTSMTMIPSGGGYVVLSAGGFLPLGSISTPQVLALTDDSEVAVPLVAMGSFPANTGVVTSLTVCSNGYVSTATGNGTAFTPSVPALLAAPQTIWSCWHDFNPAAGGTIQVEQNAAVTVVTWNNVRNFAGTSALDDSTWQMQFYASGQVVFAWQTMAATGTPYLVGYSPAGASADPGGIDLSTALPYVIDATDAVPLTLTGTSRPVTGTSWNLTVSQIPATGLLGVDIGGVSDPGINDLASIGMPGCGLRASLDVLVPFTVTGSTHSFSLMIPNVPSLVNQLFYLTSGVFQVPPVNAFGAITSNGIKGKIGNM